MRTLLIVESPTKAKKIQKFLGNKYLVMSSCGHITVLKSVSKDFEPEYEEKNGKIIFSLRHAVKSVKEVILAVDPDREGEAIAFHLARILKLDSAKRITFNAITKRAIEEALENPREINYNLVNAQQARSVLDLLIGYELSPILWRHIQNHLSAGRVQSVALQLITERQKEIDSHISDIYYETVARFIDIKPETRLNHHFLNKNEVNEFLIEVKEYELKHEISEEREQNPPAPFITATLLQEAGKFLSAKSIMNIAQQLYQCGYITYHRTDSTELTSSFIEIAKKKIIDKYGILYSKPRQYKTTDKMAQEAHEAIRPVDMDKSILKLTAPQLKLYNLILKRTLASQMSSRLYKIHKYIIMTNTEYSFIGEEEETIFDGWMLLYSSKLISQIISPPRHVIPIEIISTETKTKAQSYFSEASLNKRLRELGIGRPSTLAQIMNTLEERDYVVRETRTDIYEAIELVKTLEIKEDKIVRKSVHKMKLFPTDIGIKVGNFLKEHFQEVINTELTAQVEIELDSICEGKSEWKTVVRKFYDRFHPKVKELNKGGKTVKNISRNNRIIGEYEGKPIEVYKARYGNVAKIGDRVISIKGYSLSKVTLNDVIKLLTYPKDLGDGLIVRKGKYGTYIRYNNKNYSVPAEITLEEAKLKMN